MSAIGPASEERRSSPPRALRRSGVVLAAVGVAILLLIYGGYEHHWPWTGINGSTATLWDWLHLLLLPIAVVILPIWLSRRDQLGSPHKAAGVTILAAFVAVVAFGYLTPWTWTGFTGNTFWDWLGLLALPLAVALIPVIRQVHANWRRRDWLIVIAALLLFLVPVLGGYLGNWGWTGFRGNTLWDWLHLLILPLLVPTVLVPALKPFATPQPSPSPELSQAPPQPLPASAPAGPATASPPAPAASREQPETRSGELGAEGRGRTEDRVRAHPHWLATVIGLSALAIAAAVVLATGGNTNQSADLGQDATRLNAIVQQFIAGKRLSQGHNRYAAAAQNRTALLAQLSALHSPPQLRGATATLREMTADSLAYNLLMAQGQTAQAKIPDAAHDALRPQFVNQFNPYAQRYLSVTYQAGEL